MILFYDFCREGVFTGLCLEGGRDRASHGSQLVDLGGVELPMGEGAGDEGF